MNYIYLDIETIPSQDEDVIKRIHEDAYETAITAPVPKEITKLKTPELREERTDEWKNEQFAKAETEAEEKYHATGLDGGYGEICCIGWAVDDDSVDVIGLERPETELLLLFWKLLREVVGSQHTIFVGHNIGFDLRFLHHRSVVNRVKPTVFLPYNAAPWQGKYVDTQYEWWGAKPGKDSSLTNLCRILGIDISDDDIDGSGVWQAYQDGRHDDIAKHCRRDVERVREIHGRLRWV